MTGGATGTKAITKEIAYNAKLFVDEKVWAKMKNPMFNIEKVTSGSVQIIFPVQKSSKASSSQPVDLLNMSGADLRLVIEDNTASDNMTARENFYVKNNPAILNIGIPLRLEVNKSVGPSNKPTEAVKDDEVEAVFEFVDPSEDTSIIKGPKHKFNSAPKTGEGFLKLFAKELKKDQPAVSDDNCIDQFAPKSLRKKCRKLNERIKASNILYSSEKGKHTPFTADTVPNENRAKTKIKASSQKGHLEGYANFFFCPPLILGDNYRLKITLIDAVGKPTVLKDDKYQSRLSSFQTPIVTIWKKVRIHMVAHQYSASYNKVMWDEIKNAYNDAFIKVEEPLPQRIISIPMSRWMDYLGKAAYLGPLRKKLWNEYKAKASADHSNHFGQYSFPQETPSVKGSKDLTPRDEKPKKGPSTWTTWHQLQVLAEIVITDKLLSDKTNPTDKLGSVQWKTFKDPSKGRKYGLCVLLCKPPYKRSVVGGAYIGNKIFFMIEGADPTGIFAHEMGHALFLNHGATKYEPATVTSTASPKPMDAPLVLRTEESGSEGPYFDEHRSEDLIPCTMSYYNGYYDKGSKRADADPVNNCDHPVDWHFCGVCLLRLRFYDTTAMLTSASTIFRRLQYTKTKSGYPKFHDDPGRPPLKIAVLEKSNVLDKAPGAFPDAMNEISFPNSITLKKGKSKQVFALYPQEGTSNTNNRNFNCYKDLTWLAGDKSLPIKGKLRRVEWVSSSPKTAYVKPTYVKATKIWSSFIKTLRIGNTQISFRINISEKEHLESIPVKVTVKK